MQPILSCEGEEVLGKLGRFAREHSINVGGIAFAVRSPVSTGETMGIVLTFSDGSGIGVALTSEETQKLIERLTTLLHAPDSGPVKMQVVRDTSGLQ